ncbi:MAG: hypothetical protein JST84_03510 [Acidobacteria bacterium]|nr:hypothetical protein [Acidobacteriota bacterium]
MDLFPLVSAWAYCGACGLELPANSTICPQCSSVAVKTKLPEAEVASTLLPEPQSVEIAPPLKIEIAPPLRVAPSQALILSTATSSPSLPLRPLASPTEIAKARRLQIFIKFIFAMIWLLIIALVLWWARDWVNQPIDPVIP